MSDLTIQEIIDFRNRLIAVRDVAHEPDRAALNAAIAALNALLPERYREW